MVIDRKYDFHPRRPNLNAAEFEHLELERAETIYRERFANAADFDFVFVGNFSIDSLLDLAKQYIATLPASEVREKWKDSGLRLHPGPIDTLVIKGQTPKAEVMLEWHSPFDYQDQMERYHFTALRRLLDIRLREELREELSGVYGVRLNASFRARPDTFAFVSVRFNCEPAQVDTLLSRIHEEMQAVAAGQIDADNLRKIQNGQLKAYEEALRTNNFWLGQLANRLDMGRPFSGLYPGKYEALVAQLDPNIIAEQAQRYILGGYYFQFILLPEDTSGK
jgi:zinc protease